METLYIKQKNGRYKEVGYDRTPKLNDGVWLVQKTDSGSSTTSMIWKIGDVPLADVRIHTTLQKFDDKLCGLFDTIKTEYGVEIYNISMGELSAIILRELAIWTQEDLDKK
jgi:hypothetical protein